MDIQPQETYIFDAFRVISTKCEDINQYAPGVY